MNNLPKDDDLNDPLDDLIGSPIAKPVTLPASYTPKDFAEPCRKCRGTGVWRPGYPCFTCKGKGKLTFKTSPETRAAKRESSANVKARSAAGNLEWFKAAQPEVFAWIDGNNFAFAVSMREAIEKYGDLTPNQVAACHRCIEKLKAAKAASEDRRTNAPTMDAEKIAAALRTALANGLKKPALRIAGFKFSFAKADSANAGAIYVKQSGEYLGKIKDGRFQAQRSCGDERQAQVLAIGNDPLQAAIAHGKLTRSCACCGRELSDPESVARGIGPICETNFFG